MAWEAREKGSHQGVLSSPLLLVFLANPYRALCWGQRKSRLLVGGSEDSAQGKADLVKGIVSLPSISAGTSEGRGQNED